MLPKLTLIYDRRKQAGRSKTGVVELRITLGNKRKYISTGVRLLKKEWSNGSVVGRQDWKEVNEKLQTFLKVCSVVVSEMINEGNLDLTGMQCKVEERIMQQQTFIDYAREIAEHKCKKLSEGTQKRYKVFFKFMDSWKGIVAFGDVTERKIMQMDEKLEKKGLKECSRWNYHKILKTFILKAIDDGLLKRNPYSHLDIKRGDEDGIVRFLSPAEFHRFESCRIPIKRYERIRDLFVFQTYTMLSYCDLSAFNYKRCTRKDGKVIYKAKRIKTGQPFTIMLLDPALEILKKYHYELPIISNEKYNSYLKTAIMYAMVDKDVTSHWARHTGATMLLNEGKVSIHVIQHMMGHASIRETEKTYAKLMDDSIVEDMVKYNKRFKKKRPVSSISQTS